MTTDVAKLSFSVGAQRYEIQSRFSTPDGKWVSESNRYFSHKRRIVERDGRDAPVNVRQSEARAIAGNEQVARDGQLQTCAQAEAVDGGDDRLLGRAQREEGAVQLATDLADVEAAEVLDVAHVDPGREGLLAGRVDEEDPDLGVLARLRQGLAQLDQHAAVDGVEHLGSGEGQPEKGALPVENDGLRLDGLTHGSPPLEDWIALLFERRDAFLGVLGGAQRLGVELLEAQPLVERKVAVRATSPHESAWTASGAFLRDAFGEGRGFVEPDDAQAGTTRFSEAEAVRRACGVDGARRSACSSRAPSPTASTRGRRCVPPAPGMMPRRDLGQGEGRACSEASTNVAS